MEGLADRYADRAVRSVFIYTREAHPGENYHHHQSMDDKRHNARAFKAHSKIKRQILLDDLEGSAHHAYGLPPNMTWIIGRGGFIHYKSSWTAAADVEDALEKIIHFQDNRIKEQLVPFYSERSAWSVRDREQFMQGLERAGPQAVEDYKRMLKKGSAGKPPPPDTPRQVPGNFYKPKDDEPVSG
ncbi:MAG: hypothetical protein OEY85_07555 [Rhodospirillales bacterium]|nr:hypothetical protein [Rhodospirillales bacterium]